MDIQFPDNTISLFPEEENTYSHYERSYLLKSIDSLKRGSFASLPVFFREKNNVGILFSEADVYDYPHMFLQAKGDKTLTAMFPKEVAETKPQEGNFADRNVVITKEHPYISKTKGERTLPWRFFVISNDDATFVEQDMVLCLSRPSKLSDTSWIRPGKVAWDWWNANNIYGVGFISGLNTATYRYYIDFANDNKIEYVILDEGWTKSTEDILHFNPNIAVRELINYAKKKDVGIILWCLWRPLDENMEEILDTYASWGIAGIKVDFMQRADRYMVSSYERIAKQCAKRHLLVDFHGAFKPAGLRKAYPNIMSYEGVKGNEHNKWSHDINPQHNLRIPFIRMGVGPMDYTPGAMHNSQAKNHRIRFDRPMTIGTRAHQVAMYIVYESGLQMLCDSPSNYKKEQETTNFISQIPTIWDTTKVLESKVGEYLTVARKHGNKWYIGSMTYKKREVIIDFSFLPAGSYEAIIFKDGINADKYAEDYSIKKLLVTNKTKIKARLSEGGGWSSIIRKKI
ncbi:alpha-glucosidase [Elysia marginata]|uniref:Alpha-glucosidase n=1 Tax=Elysia marginata TaxID=1093978 RepID=A0AAV4FVX8_9GAST|nr:alpha-glucosidase [Elysia marginata]